jgi:endogenous inhibitor of DNA gyrase (YacG/DUF329 family)
MNTCAWCNKSVDDHKTIWVRKNLVIGYPFCSNRCKTDWVNSKNQYKPKEIIKSSNENSFNENQDDHNYDYDIGSSLTKPKQFDDFKSELRYYEELQNKLGGKQRNNDTIDRENIETARKTMVIIRKLLPHWKIILPIVAVLIVIAIIFIKSLISQMILYAFVLLIAGGFWAYFNEPKE